MTIETKLAPGETGWMMRENRAIEVTVTDVVTESCLDGMYQAVKTDVTYHVLIKGEGSFPVCEEFLFPGKQELLESL